MAHVCKCVTQPETSKLPFADKQMELEDVLVSNQYTKITRFICAFMYILSGRENRRVITKDGSEEVHSRRVDEYY